MKTKLLILAVLTSGYLTAQITVNSSHFFNVGDNYTRGESTTLTTNDSPGANKTWSYTSLDTNDGIEVYTYLNPSTTTSGSQFPSANIAEEESYNSYFEFYNKTATNLDFVGIDEGGDLLIFSNPATFYSFPIAYEDNHFDTFEAKQVVVGDGGVGDPDSVKMTITGVKKYKVDSWGTLVLPTGSFNALRVKDTLILNVLQEELYSGVWSVSGVLYSDTNYSNVFISNDGNAKKELLTQELSEAGAVEYNTWNYTTPSNPVGINEIRPSIELVIYPNPSSDKINIDSKTMFNEYVITDVTGKIIDQKKGFVSTQIDIKQLKAGNYILTLKNSEIEISEKFVKK